MGHEEIQGVINMFTISIVMIGSQCIHMPQFTKLCAFNMYGLLCVN